MGKKPQKAKSVAKASTKERTGCITHALSINQGNATKSISRPFPKQKTGLKKQDLPTSTRTFFVPTETTVDEWFGFWIENIVGDLAPNTLRNYRERYAHNIQPVIGRMAISSVKPMHCKKVLLQMDAIYAGSTIRQAYITMGTMFKAAK